MIPELRLNESGDELDDIPDKGLTLEAWKPVIFKVSYLYETGDLPTTMK